MNSNLKERLEYVCERIIEENNNELKEQGHSDTGALINSAEIKIEEVADGLKAAIYYLAYIQQVNQGVPASKIPYNRGSGAKSSKYIKALIAWAKRKGMDNPRSAAFAIANQHKREGMPTRKSYRFSSNNRRTGAIDATLNRLDAFIQNTIGKGAVEQLETIIDTIFEVYN